MIEIGIGYLAFAKRYVAEVDPKAVIHPELEAIEGDLLRVRASTRNAIRSLRQLT